MKAFKRITVFFIIFSISFNLYGCWDYREINSLLIVTGVSIDRNTLNNKFILTFEMFDPDATGQFLEPVFIKSEGITVFDAIRKAIDKRGKRFYWAHCKVLFISKSIADDDILSVLDLFNRDDELRPDIDLVITNTKYAYDVFYTKKNSNSISYKIDESLNSFPSSGEFSKVSLNNYILLSSSEGIEPVIPLVSIEKCFMDYKTVVKGLAVFKNGKIVGYLSPDESKYYNILLNKKFNGLILLSENSKEYDNGKEKQNISLTLEVKKATTSIKPVIKDKKVVININVAIDASIAEIDSNKINFINKREREILTKNASLFIKSNITNLIYVTQNELNSDILGFGKSIHMYDPKIWNEIYENSGDYFNDLYFNINVDLNLTNSGSNKKIIQEKY
ncbi:MAG: Ger(x)C family spore germination protein [Clostridiaceae bacterium]